MSSGLEKQIVNILLRGASPTSWNSSGEAVDATASAFRPAEGGRAHYITGIYACYTRVQSGALRVFSGTSEIFVMRSHVTEPPYRFEYAFTSPFACGAGDTVSAFLSPGTGSNTGNVNLLGFTLKA
jgi:hypothetical protein